MLKFIIFIFTIFVNTANSFASDNIYLIEDNEIYLENNGNVLELRENAKEISFQNAFNILSRKIKYSNRYLNRLSNQRLK